MVLIPPPQAEVVAPGRLRLNPSLPDTAQQIYSFLGIELLHKHTHSVDDPSLHLKYQVQSNLKILSLFKWFGAFDGNHLGPSIPD